MKYVDTIVVATIMIWPIGKPYITHEAGMHMHSWAC
jgi:hypothetical protein